MQNNRQNLLHSYKILAPAEMDAEPNPKIATQKCLESTTLDPDFYRIGHTKASDIKIISSCSVSLRKKKLFNLCLHTSKHTSYPLFTFTFNCD